MIELEYDDHTILTGEVMKVDNSFSHEFGIEKCQDYDVEYFHIIVYIGGIDYDVTSAITGKSLWYFKEKLIEHAISTGYV
jgi:hypothetical protein